MRLMEAEQKLLALKQPVLRTQDVSACLKIDKSYASKILDRLVTEGQFIHLMRGRWAVSHNVSPLILPEYLTAPFPSYISFQTALFYHGMISQIPSIIYAATLGRTRRYSTPLATISVHYLQPDFFFGFEPVNGVKMATPEKALLDVFYLAATKTRLFKTLPEIELPSYFSQKKCHEIIKKISSSRLKTLVKHQLEEVLR